MPLSLVSSPRMFALGCGIVVLLLLGVWWAFVRTTEPIADNSPKPGISQVPDPRLTIDTPYRNVKPEVAYLGDKACAVCHIDIDKSYHQHPMGRSAALTIQATEVERYDVGANNPFAALERFEFRVEKQKDRVLHHISSVDKSEKQAAYSVEATLAIGSGTRGRSYLCVRDGVIWQSPVSWFSEKKVWDISPGYMSNSHFQRPIDSSCLYCHTDQVKPVDHSRNRFEQPIFRTQGNIGCERCHGPGELHVAERSAEIAFDGIDTSIVNPKHLSPALRDSICQQCHLQGASRVVRRGRDFFEYRPGLPFDAFVSVYQRHPNMIDYGKSVGQFEQLQTSKCFMTSKGQMSCTSCHDPHDVPVPAAKAAFYRGKCVACHQTPATECTSPLPVRHAKADNCVTCHMSHSSSTTIAHTAVTDHRILRNPSLLPAHQPRPIPLGEVPLIPLYRGQTASNDAEAGRDLGIALAIMSTTIPTTETGVREIILTQAETRLREAVKLWPDDVPALEGLAEVLIARDRKTEALKLLLAIVSLIPDHERALARAVEPAMQMGQTDLATVCANKAVEMNPSSIEHRLLRARVRMSVKHWADAEADCRAALRENPAYGVSRVLLAICRHHLGDLADAQRELKLALSMVRDPAQVAYLRNWFLSTTK